MSDLSDISKVYLFLSQRNDWVKEADTNSDSTITKYEFGTFMKNNYDFTDVSENDQNELINKFWAKFDTNRSGKVFNNSKLRNKNALDSKEIDALNKKVEVFEALNEYVSKLVAPNSVDAAKWKSSVSESLTNYAEEFVNQGKNASDLTAYLDSIKGLVSNKTTANLYAQNYAEQATVSLARQYGYNVKSDSQLQGIIDNYVLSLNGTESTEDIIAGVKEAIDNYIASGNIGTSNSNQYTDNSSSQVGELNDIQKSIAKTKIKEYADTLYDTTFESLFSGLSFSSEDVKKEFKTALSSLIDSAVESFINKMSQSDFNNLDEVVKSFNPADYVTDDMKKDVYSKYYSAKTDDTLDKLANELVKGVTAVRANEISSELGFDLYNSKVGEFKLDAKTIKTLLKDLSSVTEEFVNNFIQSGKSPNKFESEFEDFIYDYLFTSSADAVNEALDDVTKEAYIGNSKLASYKETCKSAVADIITLQGNLKLGSKKITSENYKEVIESYTDGNDLMDDMKTMLASIDTSVRINKYIEQAKTNATETQKTTVAAAANTLSGLGSTIMDNHLSEIVAKNGSSEMLTEFGLDSNGKLVFEHEKTKTVLKEIVTQAKNEINKNASLKMAVQALGGDDIIETLVQAAWVNTYNTFNSSQYNNTTSFITKVLENLDTIINKLKTNPENLNLYTVRMSYADTSLTKGLVHYETNTTSGNDAEISYKGNIKTDDNGTVHIANETDDVDYQTTMNALLKRVINKYSEYLDEKTITELFQSAQKSAIETCQNDYHDCPYATGRGGRKVEDTTKNWKGGADRKGDKSKINMSEIVQLTLYYFDKLLYQKISA